MSIDYDPTLGHPVVDFTLTTSQQLGLIKDELEQRFSEVSVLWNRAQEEADCTDQIDNDLDGLHAALFNVLCDLEVDGYEMDS